MQQVKVSDLRELRRRTSAGMMECRAALEEAGDIDAAAELLRQWAVAEAAKRATRYTGEGVMASYVHHDRRLAAIVEVNCETDFVARTDDFQALGRLLAEHVAATAPASLDELLTAEWVREPGRTIGEIVKEASGRVGENIRVRRFVRLKMGDERWAMGGEAGPGPVPPGTLTDAP